MVKSKKPPTEAEVTKSVSALLGSDAARAGERIRDALERLEANGLREPGKMTLTEKGRSRALDLLESSARSAPTRWPALKARLAEIALRPKSGGRAMTASAMCAAALSAKLDLPEESSSPSKVLDAFAARELGMSGKRLTVANVRAHILTRALGIDSLRDPKRIGAVATAKILDVARTDATSIRDAVLRDWLAKPKSTPKPFDLDSFATAVKELARASDERFGRHKVFIAPVWERARANATLRELSESEFKAKLIDAHRAGLLRLSRADLTPAMSREMVAASEVPYLNAVFHFVDLEGSLS
jgi:hypothetical protein